MRLLKIGRDASCDIVLQSDKVSSLHAEMTILNNGDILLEDKNSRNGTFLMNKPIKPGTSVSIRRGDAIRFADMELMWNQIPMQENNSNFKALYGIGTNFRNEIQISGNTASRFHATLKIGKDGKAYIQDHSKNGTTVNGTKIVHGQNVKIKRNDAIACGGIPVDVKRFIPPRPWDKILKAAAVAAIVIGVIFGGKYFMDSFSGGGKPKDYIQATTYVHGYYHYVAKLTDDPFIQGLKDYGIDIPYPESYSFGKKKTGEWGIIEPEIVYQTLQESPANPMGYEGTAFFISKDGKMLTNRHVACPWFYMASEDKDAISQYMAALRERLLPLNQLRTNGDLEQLVSQQNYVTVCIYYLLEKGVDLTKLNAWIKRFINSPIEITGVHDYIAVGYANHNYNSIDEFERCTVLAESEDEKIDLAILQLNSKQTPNTVKNIISISNAVTDAKKISPLEENYYYIGYPLGISLNLNNTDGGLIPRLNEVKISKTPGKYEFDLQGEVFGGASGSPILDKKGRLVGIVNKSIRYTTMSMGVLAKYAKELYERTENQ
ncbi:FHA domain-containing protein [Bacteroides rodentium]|uniref:FHA domain-containing protein n=1 Tax=Bacteroides rodentium TaxID=691816 RepID=UPI000A8A1BCB|nr:FHA domain-containing protein [Bacteroides rodentium]